MNDEYVRDHLKRILYQFLGYEIVPDDFEISQGEKRIRIKDIKERLMKEIDEYIDSQYQYEYYSKKTIAKRDDNDPCRVLIWFPRSIYDER